MTRFEPMEAAVAQHRQEGIVRAVRLVPCGGVVFYASVRAENRRRLVTLLWEHFRPFSNRVAHPIRLVHDSLGRPRLLVGEHRGPAVSFSTAGEEVWAALCGDGSNIGIDVAGSAEFQEGYPVHRVFHEPELHPALELTGGDLSWAAALLWSVKEAVAKALGCAFHLVDPRDIHVHPTAVEDYGVAFSVRLSGKALVRFPMADRRPITVRSLPRDGTWLSIAALDWAQWRCAGIH